MLYRCIAPDWLTEENPSIKKVLEGEFSDESIKKYNSIGYNIYFLPNSVSSYDSSHPCTGSDIDIFNYVFVDCDLKDKVYPDKRHFIETVKIKGFEPTFIVDSGHGVHSYYSVSDLDAMSFLRLQRRLCRLFKTDEAICKIFQLMRVPGTINTKYKDDLIPCEIIESSDKSYTCEEMDKILPNITDEDEAYCKQHYNKTYHIETKEQIIDETLPVKFGDLLRSNSEVKNIWLGGLDDRSKGDYRLGHIMLAAGFSKAEAMSVLVNSAKALARAPSHRINYADNIVNKIWAYEQKEAKSDLNLSSSVKDILSRSVQTLKGTRFACYKYFDDTLHGYRLGQVIGLVAGSGVGKTAIALNMFMGFVQNNPDYTHFFIPLEQPPNEIADRWKTMCGDNTALYDKVEVMSNYAPDGEFRHLSLSEIKDYILRFQEQTGKKVGCIVIDHIGALRKKGAKAGEGQDLMDICHQMKAFAVQTNTLLVMQSQAPREKAGIGDLELNKDAAYGTVFFESYVDYLITLWQPLKRCYSEEAPTVTAFKFCKIRHKKQGKDVIIEDVCYKMLFDPSTEKLRQLTQDEEKSFSFFLQKATNKRKQDRKTDLVEYVSIRSDNGEADNNTDERRAARSNSLH
jgi:KaiC/GvpD/RAD55 family RecA-like ATPase